MGHRRQRKRERKTDQQFRGTDRWSDRALFAPRKDEPGGRFFDPAAGVVALHVAKSCGGCHEFVEDAEGGRGTCLHPGSGVLSPWTDTVACAFYANRRR
jgi:hypothetical protein